MNLGQLHSYLGQLIEAGLPPSMPIAIPGKHECDFPQEVSDTMLIKGTYNADPSPLAVGQLHRTEACLLLAAPTFDLDTLKATHNPQWPPIDPPAPQRD